MQEVYYKSGAAHLDLSPRATASQLKTKADRALYDTMLKHDMQWFFKIIPLCSQVRLLIFAGCTMDKIMEQCTVEKDGFEFIKQEFTEGKGRIGFYRLRGSDFDLPVFFCSVSPSARNEQKQLLIDRVKEHKEKLLELMNERPVLART